MIYDYRRVFFFVKMKCFLIAFVLFVAYLLLFVIVLLPQKSISPIYFSLLFHI